MSKEKKEVQEDKQEKKQQYHLTDIVLSQGYSAVIPKNGRHFKIGFEVNAKGEPLNPYASVMEKVNNPGRQGGQIWKWTGQTFLEDLNDEQLRQLTLAGVITLSKEQESDYKSKFYS